MGGKKESKNDRLSSRQQVIQLLASFKVKRCVEEECPFNSDDPPLFSDLGACDNFHGIFDQRRNPFESSEASVVVYCNQMEEVEMLGCFNDFEYLYHPFNFRQTECPNHRPNRCSPCTLSNCPFYHTLEERNLARKIFENIPRIGFISSSIECLNEINEFLQQKSRSLSREDKQRRRKASMQIKLPPVKAPTTVRKESAPSTSLYTLATKSKRFQLVDNTELITKFYLGQEVKMFEDMFTEFKNFSTLDVKIASNYICGFLNSFGGKLFFGINNNGFVKGMFLTRYTIRLMLDN